MSEEADEQAVGKTETDIPPDTRGKKDKQTLKKKKADGQNITSNANEEQLKLVTRKFHTYIKNPLMLHNFPLAIALIIWESLTPGGSWSLASVPAEDLPTGDQKLAKCRGRRRN